MHGRIASGELQDDAVIEHTKRWLLIHIVICTMDCKMDGWFHKSEKGRYAFHP